MPNTTMDFDRASVRRLVEDFWRSLMLFGNHLGQTQPNISRDENLRLTQEFSRQFSERNNATAALMPPEQAAKFLEMIEEEDVICFEEEQRDYDAFCRRLGLHLTSSPQRPVPYVYRRQGLGELAVRTAVRATVWQMIWSLFRR